MPCSTYLISSSIYQYFLCCDGRHGRHRHRTPRWPCQSHDRNQPRYWIHLRPEYYPVIWCVFKHLHKSILTFLASHNAFFNVIAELKDPKDFPKALTLLQTIDISLYLVAGVVIYYFAGEDVKSPALGSVNPLVSKVAYGIALPTVCSPEPIKPVY